MRALILAVASAGALALWAAPVIARPSTSPLKVIESKFAAVQRHDIDAIVAHYALDAKVTASDFCHPRQGRADVERTYRGIFGAFPDAVADIQEYVVQGNRVAVRFIFRSHISNRVVEVPITDFLTVRHGLIIRDDGVFDNGGRPCTP
ncbi:MAG TPA: nuclear transport factor 2 family protein [Caulobacteraceae bacterium]|nr:nuclear transport factor 2 family protein [Caulobacteraceae bacterium]